jgi:hypothetical protein
LLRFWARKRAIGKIEYAGYGKCSCCSAQHSHCVRIVNCKVSFLTVDIFLCKRCLRIAVNAVTAQTSKNQGGKDEH